MYALEVAETEFEEERRRTVVPSLATYGDVEGVTDGGGDVELGSTGTETKESGVENNAVTENSSDTKREDDNEKTNGEADVDI